MTFPSTARASSVGNQGEVEFYYEDSSLEPSEPEKPTPKPTTPSPPSKVLSLPQTGEKMTPYYLIGLGMISIAAVCFWKRQRSKEGLSEH